MVLEMQNKNIGGKSLSEVSGGSGPNHGGFGYPKYDPYHDGSYPRRPHNPYGPSGPHNPYGSSGPGLHPHRPPVAPGPIYY